MTLFQNPLLIILFALIVSIFQISVLGGGLTVTVNFNILILIILMTLKYEEESLWWLAVSGAVFDIYSPFRFGLNILWMIALWLIVKIIIRKFFSNINLLAATLLSLIGIFIYELPSLFIFGGWKNLLIGLPIHIAIAIIFYVILSKALPKQEKFLL